MNASPYRDPAAVSAPVVAHTVTPVVTSRLPIRILSAVAVLLLLFVIFAPQQSSDSGTMYSSYATGAGGTRALFDVLKRVGFAVGRNEKPLSAEPDSNSTYALINPAQPLTATEQARLLSAVRRGTILVFTMDNDALADSLGFETTTPADGFYTLNRTSVAGGNPTPPANPDPRTVFQTAYPISVTVGSKVPDGNQTFLWIQPRNGTKSAQLDSTQQFALVIGHRVGRGYAIAVTPAQILMNQIIREPRAAIAIVRGIQYATTSLEGQPRSNRVVFDEYHHGFGTHADMVAAVERALTGTAPGRMAIELIAAALLLLLVFGVRPLAPVAIPPVSRRSPLEHVGALAYAYSQVNAKALGTNWLLRGVRRRHPFGVPGSLPDSDYLSALRNRIPTTAADVDSILTTLTAKSSDSSDGFATTGAAVANIERAFRE